MKCRLNLTTTAGCLMMLAAATLTPRVGHGDQQTAMTRNDRAAVERVYYDHRLGNKPPFDEVLPPSALDRLIRQDLHKEAVLNRTYGIEITPAMLDAEVQRIDATTRAPAMLVELKAALGNDPNRFARAVARPALVERLLREKFDSDDVLHAPQRRRIEQARNELLTAKQSGAGCEKLLALLKRGDSNGVTETTWQFGTRPADWKVSTADEIETRKRFGPNAHTIVSRRADGGESLRYFEDLPGGLQKILHSQLRRPGDVGAVIETPGGFLLYVAMERTDAVLSVAALSLPKRTYEQWLEEQDGTME